MSKPQLFNVFFKQKKICGMYVINFAHIQRFVKANK